MTKVFIRILAVAAIVALGYAGYRFIQQLPQRQREVATTRVRRGDVVVRTFARGELQAVRSVTLTAPNLFGTVQVTRLAPLGAFAREGDLVVEFDDAEVLSRLEEKQLELDQVEERIKKAEADLAIRKNQDDVELLRARYSVRRAELEVQRNELLAEIDARKNELNLREANQRLEKLKSDIESRRKQAEAELAVLRENKRKAELEMQREQQRLRQVKLLAPMSGLVAIRQARTFFFFAGTQMPDIREGDELRPGMPVADIMDLSELEVVARVGEMDRANLREGQDVVIRLDALADKDLHGKIKSLSGTASADVYSNDPAKKFDVVFEIDMRQLLSALGASDEQIRKVLATAEQNRKRAPSQSPQFTMAGMMGGGGGMFGGGSGGFGGAGGGVGGGGMFGGAPGGQGAPGGDQGEPGGGQGGQRAGRPRGGGLTQMLSRLPEEEREKVQEALDKELKGKKMEDLSQEERREVFQKLRGMLGGSFPGRRPGGGQAVPGEPGGTGPPGAAPGGEGSTGGFGGVPGMGRSGGSQYSEAQIAAAKLPPPPEEDSQLDVLLRPGLLADVEIIVEKIPDALHVPIHAVFEKDGKPIVYVKKGDRFEERAIQALRRSESTMVIAEGLQEGEVVALADPYAKPGQKKGEQQAPPSAGGANPMSGFGGGARGR